MKLLFMPVSVVGGLIGGLLARRLFDEVWGVFDDNEPPGREHRDVPWSKAILAMALQGIVFSVARGVVDRGARLAFYRMTGTWPGEVEPDPE